MQRVGLLREILKGVFERYSRKIWIVLLFHKVCVGFVGFMDGFISDLMRNDVVVTAIPMDIF